MPSVPWSGTWAPSPRSDDGGDAALNLFRSVLLASGSIPGAFPPVLIDVEGNGKRFAEMHVDGGVGGQFFVAPPALMASNSGYRIPATQLYIVVNSGLEPEFQVVDRSTPTILAPAVGMAVKVDLRLMLDRAFVAAKNSGIGFNVATIPADFNAPSRGPFDPNYMKALFDAGYEQGKSACRIRRRDRRPIPGRRRPTRTTLPNRKPTTVQNRERPNEQSWEGCIGNRSCACAGGHRDDAVVCGGKECRARSHAYDGLWSVSIRTQDGPCDPSYRYPARIVGGQVQAGRQRFQLSDLRRGGVERRDRRHREQRRPAAPPAMAGCAAASGYGRWSAAGNQCYGTWSAMRRASN